MMLVANSCLVHFYLQVSMFGWLYLHLKMILNKFNMKIHFVFFEDILFMLQVLINYSFLLQAFIDI